ncbi:regulatory protein TetR [Sphingobium chlorophenolicum L-1]|uniref:Regulatory protein TetR n=1 Tax=Sphingobium chlorophenolicum L-1 TaxID=690566 RepID=F6EWZ4_SPHCR|nr:TetR/AcrR family transcriptional regulator [Sphingobium chlorophenolicum]AEG48157.1 regulatory protein TetR [Sphingobium chlorophenolicum L-1]
MATARSKPSESNRGTRELLIDAAEREIAHKGLEALTMKDLAKEVGIKTPSIYAHFAGRDDILRAIADRYVAALSVQFPDDGGDPLDTILAGVRSLVIYFASHPAHVRLKLRDLETPGGRPELSAAAGGEASSNLNEGPLRDFFARIEGLLHRGHEIGQIRRVSVVEFYRICFGVTLLSLTWPTQGIFTSQQDSAEISRILPFAETAIRSFLVR